MPSSERKSKGVVAVDERVHPLLIAGCHLPLWGWFGIHLEKVLKRRGVQNDVLDYLELHQNWRTSHGIALDINAKEDSVGQALTRLRKRGLVTSRPRFNQSDKGIYKPTMEWRACG
jgi:hypothetical protein